MKMEFQLCFWGRIAAPHQVFELQSGGSWPTMDRDECRVALWAPAAWHLTRPRVELKKPSAPPFLLSRSHSLALRLSHSKPWPSASSSLLVASTAAAEPLPRPLSLLGVSPAIQAPRPACSMLPRLFPAACNTSRAATLRALVASRPRATSSWAKASCACGLPRRSLSGLAPPSLATKLPESASSRACSVVKKRKDPVLELEKTGGSLCEAKSHLNSAVRTCLLSLIKVLPGA
jgi:hypothetical protein